MPNLQFPEWMKDKRTIADECFGLSVFGIKNIYMVTLVKL